VPRSEQAYQDIRERATKRILEAAGRVIARKGRTATMAEVAAEAGVSQGLAYRYFSSKEEMFYELLREMWRSGGMVNEEAQTASGTPRERLERMVSSMIQLRRDHPEFYQFLFQALTDDRLPEDVRQTMKDQGTGARKAMRRLIVEGQAAGEVAEDDPDQLVDAIMACLDGLSRRMVSLSSDEVRVQLPEARIILRMLMPDSTRHDRT
jgi:AcrR family transcriptional regulator